MICFQKKPDGSLFIQLKMKTSNIRKKLANYMFVADYKKVKAIYTLLEYDMKSEKRISVEQYNEELNESIKEMGKGEKNKNHLKISSG